MSHSPVPWHVGPHYKTDIEGPDGRVAETGAMGSPRGIANAEYIVRCVNAHDALVSALRVALEAIDRGLPYVASEEDYVAVAERACRAALKLASEA